MSKIECSIVKDLMPLFADSLVSCETREFIEGHLKECNECRNYYESLNKDLKIELPLDQKQIDDRGVAIVNEIKQAQDRVKYTFIIFAMFVAVGITLLSSGDLSIIPFIIIIPFGLRLLYREGPIILLSALGAALVIAPVNHGLGYVLLKLPLILVCTGGGIIAASAVQHIFSKDRK